MVDGAAHYYFPDFEIDKQLIEIKGDQFFNSDGTMCNPYDHTQDIIYEAKHQCMIQNNVKILTSKDYKVYVDWFYQNNYSEDDFILEKLD